ncbi:MAG: ABC transporter substrate-binding protein, partial [Candidatus Eiseniibacteriota bacterium]
VFPSRVFRHSAFYVRKDSGIASAKDLEGRTVGIPEWAQTAGIYARGMLAEYYGVDLAAIRWVQAGVNQPGRAEKVAFELPRGVAYEARPDRCLSEMLLSGEIDAACTARAPDSFLSGDPRVVRLFPDSQAEERRYFHDTGIFPIMHVVTIRRAVFEQHPWVAPNLLQAFEAAKNAAVARLCDITASRAPLPWIASLAVAAAESAGGDLWPYGVEANRTTLGAFCRFAHAQGLTATCLAPDDLFPKEVKAGVRV